MFEQIHTLTSVRLRYSQVTVILFWAKFAKGDYTTIAGVSELAKRWSGVDSVQFLGVRVGLVHGEWLIRCLFVCNFYVVLGYR